jgi:predicted nucleotidyltransferase
MSKQLINLSGKIDSLLLEIFTEIEKVSQTLSIDFFVVGATARDIILESGYGIPTIRATEDIDLGIQVSDWQEFSRFKEGLVKGGNFTSTKETQRLKHTNGNPVDIIPFGGVANQKALFTWPPEHETEMNVLGFDESYKHSILVRLNTDPPLELPFASLPGLAILKIIAWKDKYPLRKNDAEDLLLLIRNYLAAGNENRLYNEESDLMEDDFDYERTSARLLGRDMASISNPTTSQAIIEILNQETGDQSHYRLIQDMRDNKYFQNDFDRILELLEHVKTGLLERLKKV